MKKRRGLSSVVGTVFSIIALATTIGYVTYSMNVLSNFNQATLTKNQEDVDASNEKLQVVKASIINGKFNITVQNVGNTPINITRLWVENKTTTNWVHKYDMNTQVYPGQTTTNIGQNLALYARDTYAYNMKFVSERGNSLDFMMNSATQAPLYVQTHTIPETVSTEFDTVVLMSVTNNATNAATILNLTPTSTPTVDTSSCTPDCTATYVSGPIPTSYPSLKPGETATFKWIYTIAGSDSNKITFTPSISNGISGNTASADVYVRDIVSSLESGTALSTLGLASTAGSSSVLYLHDETWYTPSSSYQMASTTPDIAGDYIDVDNEDPSWFTNNGTDTIVIPAGKWNASLNYITEFLPDSLIQSGNNQVDMIFHLNDNVDNEPDSTGNTNGLDRCNGSSAPQYFSTGGPDNSPYYHFDGNNDCFQSNFNVDSNNFASILGSPDTTSLWFKANSLTALRAIMFRIDDNTSGYTKDFYQISLGDGNSGNAGKIVFEFDTNSGGSRTKCMSTARWDNNVWHHVVAVRDASNQCKLYMDGNSTPVATDTHSYSSTSVDVTNKFKIGYNGAGEYFTGDIDQIFHWNDKALSTSEISDLYNAKFGDTATLVDFSIYRTDVNGNNIQPAIKTSTNYPIKFADSKGLDSTSTYNNLADNIWKQMNYTTGSLSSVTVNPQERLNFTIVYKSGLDMILRHDDNTMTSPKSSYLQMPTPNFEFPSYFTYSRATILKVIATNGGPYGSWFRYQGTRAVFDDLASTTSYAGLICSVNSTLTGDECNTGGSNSAWRITEDRDSIFIPVGSIVNMYFWEIQDRPDRNLSGGTKIPAGDYHMYVFIDGYDETGKAFLRNMDIGKVKVTN